MRQTAEKAVPFAKSGAKPQPESEHFKKKQKHRETLGKNRQPHPAQSRVYYHSEVRTPIATAMFGEHLKNHYPVEAPQTSEECFRPQCLISTPFCSGLPGITI